MAAAAAFLKRAVALTADPARRTERTFASRDAEQVARRDERPWIRLGGRQPGRRDQP
jgi:hypothetical protein